MIIIDNCSTDSTDEIVQSINDNPVITAIEDQKINEDEKFNLKLFAKDAENDPLTYGATVDANAVVNVTNDNLTIAPKKNYYGPNGTGYTSNMTYVLDMCSVLTFSDIIKKICMESNTNSS